MTVLYEAAKSDSIYTIIIWSYQVVESWISNINNTTNGHDSSDEFLFAKVMILDLLSGAIQIKHKDDCQKKTSEFLKYLWYEVAYHLKVI